MDAASGGPCFNMRTFLPDGLQPLPWCENVGTSPTRKVRIMFYEGDLQSGIALAVQQAKAVLCFVKDESSTSEQWEAVLSDIAELVKAETVALRLNAGSQEAGFLSS